MVASQEHSRAWYRIGATRTFTGSKKTKPQLSLKLKEVRFIYFQNVYKLVLKWRESCCCNGMRIIMHKTAVIWSLALFFSLGVDNFLNLFPIFKTKSFIFPNVHQNGKCVIMYVLRRFIYTQRFY